MKSLVSSIVIVAMLGVTLGIPSVADETATVTATVRAQNISVNVTDGTVSYGAVAVNSNKSTLAGELNDTQNAVNNGNIVENFNIKGQDSANWTLEAATGTDAYKHQYSTTSGSVWSAMSTSSYATLGTSVALNATTTFDLRICTPSTSNSYATQTVSVTVQAVSAE